MDRFLGEEVVPKSAFVLKGYAGTGKTSVVAALVKALPRLNMRSLMMAPTGRAAKVMSGYAGKTGFTIHKIIYRPSEDGASSGGGFELQKNYYQQTLFIVDEASMLADDSGTSNFLLRDLALFVFQHDSNRLLLIGDEAQLPPVGSEHSPALDRHYLVRHFGLTVEEVQFTEVTRQQMDSGILYNATRLRNELAKKEPTIRFYSRSFKDFFRMNGERLEDGLRYAYDTFGLDSTVIVTRSNKAAVQYNQYIRRTIHFFEDEISAGDRLMIVKNNYTYMADSDRISFLANGDFVEILKIRSFEELYGLRFATLELRLIDYPDEPYFEAKIILDTLYSTSPSLGQEEWSRLYREVSMDYQDVSGKKELRESLKKDPYLNALQVKFAYALTCHKSQGGQWDAVFVDQGYLTDQQLDRQYIRWLYTAMTRAKEVLFMVNFHGKFFLKSVEELD
ncbi:RecD-like DNA helicase [Lunatimonas lonarensis]|uniref:RecD-like DNA helicase n=1 Tax=Lunatimonas lonarensis TaxID=1232681 RepID=R7ZQC7_9BACT|nr:ATP-binding domain-containing protein [Lunatimonas lonarensis]EON76287.1 RecD-like DNA helicase [Lunatimonas lonarensis]